MTVHVGIVLYNSVNDLPACIDALHQQTYDDLQIHAFDNASTDGGAVWLRENEPNVLRTVSTTNVGFGAAHNRILRDLIAREEMGEGDYYLALNPDALLAADYVLKLVRVMEADEGIGWASGKLVMPFSDKPQAASRKQEPLTQKPGEAADHEKKPHPLPLSISSMSPSVLGEGRKAIYGVPTPESHYLYSVGHGMLRNGYAFNIGYGMADEERFTESREVFGVPAAAVLMRAAFMRDLWEDNGLYDEAFFLYGEDTDVDWRGQRSGWRCWLAADAIADHRGSTANPQMAAEAVANRYLSAVKNSGARDRWLLIVPLMVVHTAARLILSPSNGRSMLRVLRQGLPKVWQKRNRRWREPAMERWFEWSHQQPTSQPRRWGERVRMFGNRNLIPPAPSP